MMRNTIMTVPPLVGGGLRIKVGVRISVDLFNILVDGEVRTIALTSRIAHVSESFLVAPMTVIL